MRRFTNFKLGGVVLTLLFLLGVSGNSWGQEVSDEIVATECVGLPSGNSVTYSNFSDVVGNSGAVYAGRMACTKDGAIQLNNSSSDKGIITTASGGKRVKSIIVEWQPTSSNVLSIYGKTSKYSSAGDLYDTPTQGTLLGSLTNGETTLNVYANVYPDKQRKLSDKLVTAFVPTIQDYPEDIDGPIYESYFNQRFKINIEDKRTRKAAPIYKSMAVFPTEYFFSVKNVGSSANGMHGVNKTFIKTYSLVNINGELYPSIALRMYLLANDMLATS